MTKMVTMFMAITGWVMTRKATTDLAIMLKAMIVMVSPTLVVNIIHQGLTACA